MSEAEQTLDFGTAAERLERFAPELGASELHGMLCGLLCGRGDGAGQLLADQLPGIDRLAGAERGELLALVARLERETLAAIDGPGTGFRPLLPDDLRPLVERAAAISEWCQGFLYGFGLAGIDGARLSAIAREGLADMAEITRLDRVAIDEDEAAEEALVELQEFVWVAAMLVREELIPDPTERS